MLSNRCCREMYKNNMQGPPEKENALLYHTYVFSERATLQHAVAFTWDASLGREAGCTENDKRTKEEKEESEVDERMPPKKGVIKCI